MNAKQEDKKSEGKGGRQAGIRKDRRKKEG